MQILCWKNHRKNKKCVVEFSSSYILRQHRGSQPRIQMHAAKKGAGLIAMNIAYRDLNEKRRSHQQLPADSQLEERIDRSFDFNI